VKQVGGSTARASLILLAVSALGLSAQTATTGPQTPQPVFSPMPGRVEQRGDLTVTLGPVRQILRGTRTPLVTAYRDGSLVLAGQTQSILSTNRGDTWRPVTLPQVQLNTIELANRTTLMLEYDPRALADRPGWYTVQRWTSRDKGLTVEGPFAGELHLPQEALPGPGPHWFHGNLLEMPGGALLAVTQSETLPERIWTTALVRSDNGGKDWSYVSTIASKDLIADPQGLLRRAGWPLYYACEPNLIHLGGNELLCVMRSANDERANLPETLIGPPAAEFHDLWSTVAGDGIHASLMHLDASKFYLPGPPNAALIIAYSHDAGATWVGQQPMQEARGCFPRLAQSEGILALTYGGLSGVPRWGNAISFSTDGGRNWSAEIVFGPVLTTGYTAVVVTGPGKFLVFFDCTPPQPWTNEPAWWIGCLDVTVTRK
jgi:hypothetical protein